VTRPVRKDADGARERTAWTRWAVPGRTRPAWPGAPGAPGTRLGSSPSPPSILY